MLKGVPLLATTLLLASIFIYQFANLQLGDIRANWNERRCEPLVMSVAHMVPDGTDPSVDPNSFSSDNFSFCITKLIDSALTVVTSPFLQSFTKVMDTTNPIRQMMEYLSTIAGKLTASFTQIFAKMFDTFRVTIFQVARIFWKVQGIFQRVFAIAVSTIFAGMSMWKAIMNSMNVVIQVCIIILTILVALVVFLFFAMIPVIPIIMTMIGVLSATVYESQVSGMRGSFCVAAGTLVATAEGWVPVETLKPGDILGSANGGVIEGVLKTTGVGADCVRIDGVIMSTTHLIQYRGKWMSAKDHPNALPIKYKPAFLYCLNTTNHIWRVRATGLPTSLVIRDWEELPDGVDEEWEKLVSEILGSLESVSDQKVADQKAAASSPGRGLVGSGTLIYEKSRGIIPISEVIVGDLVQDWPPTKAWARVLGTYIDIAEKQPFSGPNEAAWVYKNIWIHPPVVPRFEHAGYHLITDSGTFVISTGEWLRDFTEVGINRIHETYDFVLSQLQDRSQNA